MFTSSGEGIETPTLLGPLETVSLNHWMVQLVCNFTCHFIISALKYKHSPQHQSETFTVFVRVLAKWWQIKSHTHMKKENLKDYTFIGNYCRVNNESCRPAPNNYVLLWSIEHRCWISKAPTSYSWGPFPNIDPKFGSCSSSTSPSTTADFSRVFTICHSEYCYPVILPAVT
jgi:hypothetical protein